MWEGVFNMNKKMKEIVVSATLGLAAVLEFIMSSPELKPNKISDDEDNNKRSIELRLTEPLLIADKKLKIYASASIAANPMLPAVIFLVLLKLVQTLMQLLSLKYL